MPKLLEAASVPAPTVNWCGEQTVSIQEWCSLPRLARSAGSPSSRRARRRCAANPTDVTRMRELVGGTTVDWRDGMRRMVAKFHPELVG